MNEMERKAFEAFVRQLEAKALATRAFTFSTQSDWAVRALAALVLLRG